MLELQATASLALALTAFTAPPALATDPALGQLTWLGGCWAGVGAEAGTGEQWMPPAGDALLGIGRTIRGGRTVGYEFMRIALAPDGRLAFFAQPSGKPPVSFPVLRQAPHEVVFENLAHDFPQRIVYRLAAPDSLHARIEGLRQGVARQVDFPMARVVCEAWPAPAAPASAPR